MNSIKSFFFIQKVLFTNCRMQRSWVWLWFWNKHMFESIGIVQWRYMEGSPGHMSTRWRWPHQHANKGQMGFRD